MIERKQISYQELKKLYRERRGFMLAFPVPSSGKGVEEVSQKMIDTGVCSVHAEFVTNYRTKSGGEMWFFVYPPDSDFNSAKFYEDSRAAQFHNIQSDTLLGYFNEH